MGGVQTCRIEGLSAEVKGIRHMGFTSQQESNRHWLSDLERLFAGIIVVSVLLGFNGGCGNKNVPPPEIVFTVDSAKDTNDGQPFYCAIRSVNANQFLTEGYDGVANMLFANPPNASVLAAQVILPGEEQEIKIEKRGKDELGFYCFFTEPGEPWKIKLDQPLGDEYEIELEKNRISSSEKESADGGILGCLWPF
jgi:hypothetical protein